MRSKVFLDKSKIIRSFSKSAHTYDKHASFQKDVGNSVLKKLFKLKTRPNKIIDIGTGTGELAFSLRKKYKNSEITGYDISDGMIKVARSKNKDRNIHFMVAEAENFPYKKGAIDIATSSLAYQWVDDLTKAFSEVNKALRKDGIFIFTTLGTHTLKELRRSYGKVSKQIPKHLMKFKPLAKVQNALKKAGFKNIKVRTDMIKRTYPSPKKLLESLIGLGARNSTKNTQKGLSGKDLIKKLYEDYSKNYSKKDKVFATYEVITVICRK